MTGVFYDKHEVGSAPEVLMDGCITILCRVHRWTSGERLRQITSEISAQVRAAFGGATNCRVRFEYHGNRNVEPQYRLPTGENNARESVSVARTLPVYR